MSRPVDGETLTAEHSERQTKGIDCLLKPFRVAFWPTEDFKGVAERVLCGSPPIRHTLTRHHRERGTESVHRILGPLGAALLFARNAKRISEFALRCGPLAREEFAGPRCERRTIGIDCTLTPSSHPTPSRPFGVLGSGGLYGRNSPWWTLTFVPRVWAERKVAKGTHVSRARHGGLLFQIDGP